jgi:hypothetical protein
LFRGTLATLDRQGEFTTRIITGPPRSSRWDF